MITVQNYKQEVNRIGVSKLPDTLKASYEFFGKATAGYTDYHRIETPGKIADVWAIYLEKLNEFAGSIKEDKTPAAKSASTIKKELKHKKFIKQVAKKAVALVEKRKAERTEQARKEMVAKFAEAGRNSKPKPSPKPKAEPKVKTAQKVAAEPKEAPAPKPDTHIYNEDIPIEVKFIKSYLSMDGRQKTRAQLLGFLSRLQKAIREHKIRATSKFVTEIRHIQKETIAVINSLKNNTPFTFELDKSDEKALQSDWKDQFSEKYKVKLAISIIKRFIGLQGKSEVKAKAQTLLAFIKSAIKTGKVPSECDYYGEVIEIEKSLTRYLEDKDAMIVIHEQSLNGLMGMAGMEKKSLGSLECNCPKITPTPALGFLPELANNIIASMLYDKVISSDKPGLVNTEQPSPEVTPAAPGTVSGLGSTAPGVIRSEQLKHIVYTPLGLTGDWKVMLGDVSKPFAMMVYGKPGSGKSTFNLRFAKYLGDIGKKVLIISGEEKLAATMKEKFERLQAYSPNIFISPELLSSYDGFDVVFIDSVQHLNLEVADLTRLLEDNMAKGVSFVFVFHATKEGNYRGVASFEHLVDISMKVEGGVTIMGKNRFGGQGSMKVY